MGLRVKDDTLAFRSERWRGDGEDDAGVAGAAVMPYVCGIRRDAHAVFCGEWKLGTVHLQYDAVAGKQIGDFLTLMAAGVAVGAHTGRDDHHAKLDATLRVRRQQFIAYVRRTFEAEGKAVLRVNDWRFMVFFAEKHIDRRVQCSGDTAKRVDRWIDQVVLDLAQHRWCDLGEICRFSDGKAFCRPDFLYFFTETRYIHIVVPPYVTYKKQ